MGTQPDPAARSVPAGGYLLFLWLSCPLRVFLLGQHPPVPLAVLALYPISLVTPQTEPTLLSACQPKPRAHPCRNDLDQRPHLGSVFSVSLNVGGGHLQPHMHPPHPGRSGWAGNLCFHKLPGNAAAREPHFEEQKREERRELKKGERNHVHMPVPCTHTSDV